jgi:heme exporter protein B
VVEESSRAPSVVRRASSRPTLVGAAWEICQKDLRIERRTGEIVATAGVFAVLVGFLASMAFRVDDKTNASTAAGTIWITIFFASVLSFGRVWQRERDESALTGLLVAPIPRASIFLGKALATFAMIVLVEVPLVALTTFLFHIDALAHAGELAAFCVSGTFALALLGTLFGAMTVRTRARDLVLAIVLFPLLSPVLVCGVVGTRKVFEAQPLETWSGFLGLIGVFDFVALAVGIGLFGALVDE